VELIVRLLIFAAYVSILIELTMLHVSSVASFRSIWAADDNITMWYSQKYVRLFRLGKLMKLTLFLPPLLAVYAVFLFPIPIVFLDVQPPLGFVFEPHLATNWVAFALIVAGRAITLISVVSMLREETSPDLWALNTSGLFRYSRNPGLAGMFIMFVGFWVLLPSSIFLAGILIYFAYMDFKVRMEEDFLTNRFGVKFQTYREKTSRYLL
jgi:protein-S-isoprenylcysteine O-methyltransferase Ste14